MIAKSLGASVVVFLMLAGPASAQTILAWKFAKGQVFEVERSATQKQAVTIDGKEIKQSRASVWHVRLEVTEQKADAATIQARLTKVEQTMEGAADGETIDPKLSEKMQGSVFTVTVTPSGKVKDLAGYGDFLKRLGGTDKTRLKALRVTFPESAVKEALADCFGPLPEQAVKPGDSWQRVYVEPIPHFGSLRSTARYVYEGKARNRDRIAYTIQTKYEIPKKAASGLFRVVEGSIESEQAKGTIAFDRAAGRLVEHERSMRLRGKLTIEAMDRRQEIGFTSENQVKIRVK